MRAEQREARERGDQEAARQNNGEGERAAGGTTTAPPTVRRTSARRAAESKRDKAGAWAARQERKRLAKERVRDMNGEKRVIMDTRQRNAGPKGGQ